jgi:dihydroflavonol-4-reductase
VDVFVTGASGFVGSHVVRALERGGASVRCERVDVLDPPGLERALRGCDAVVHVAALYSYDADPRRLEAVNVDGTRNVLEAAARAGVTRVVHTSTAGTCGPVAGRPASEADRPPRWELSVPYKRTKLAAERLVLDAARRGLEAVVVNPTTPVGGGDRRPTPTGAMVAGVARGRIRAYVPSTGLNVVDVRDVAHGHVLALEHGRRGERYLLGGTDLLLRDLFATIAEIAGLTPPRLRVPYPVVRAAAALGLANRNEVRLARLPMFFDSSKAERELGYAAGPVEPALARAVHEALADQAPRPLELYLSRAREIRRAARARHEPAIPSRT